MPTDRRQRRDIPEQIREARNLDSGQRRRVQREIVRSRAAEQTDLERREIAVERADDGRFVPREDTGPTEAELRQQAAAKSDELGPGDFRVEQQDDKVVAEPKTEAVADVAREQIREQNPEVGKDDPVAVEVRRNEQGEIDVDAQVKNETRKSEPLLSRRGIDEKIRQVQDEARGTVVGGITSAGETIFRESAELTFEEAGQPTPSEAAEVAKGDFSAATSVPAETQDDVVGDVVGAVEEGTERVGRFRDFSQERITGAQDEARQEVVSGLTGAGETIFRESAELTFEEAGQPTPREAAEVAERDIDKGVENIRRVTDGVGTEEAIAAGAAGVAAPEPVSTGTGATILAGAAVAGGAAVAANELQQRRARDAPDPNEVIAQTSVSGPFGSAERPEITPDGSGGRFGDPSRPEITPSGSGGRFGSPSNPEITPSSGSGVFGDPSRPEITPSDSGGRFGSPSNPEITPSDSGGRFGDPSRPELPLRDTDDGTAGGRADDTLVGEEFPLAGRDFAAREGEARIRRLNRRGEGIGPLGTSPALQQQQQRQRQRQVTEDKPEIIIDPEEPFDDSVQERGFEFERELRRSAADRFEPETSQADPLDVQQEDALTETPGVDARSGPTPMAGILPRTGTQARLSTLLDSESVGVSSLRARAQASENINENEPVFENPPTTEFVTRSGVNPSRNLTPRAPIPDLDSSSDDDEEFGFGFDEQQFLADLATPGEALRGDADSGGGDDGIFAPLGGGESR